MVSVGAANGTITMYEFAGTFTEGELAGSDFSGWFDYDTDGWGYYYETQMRVTVPRYSYADYTGEGRIGSYYSFGYDNYQDRFANSYHVWGYDPGNALTDFGWGLELMWAEPGIDREDLIPLDRLTKAVFEFNADNYFAWFDGEQFNYEKWYGKGPITDLRPVPEPATILLIGTGLIGLAGCRRKKFKKK